MVGIEMERSFRWKVVSLLLLGGEDVERGRTET